jgi:hypothetical protein
MIMSTGQTLTSCTGPASSRRSGRSRRPQQAEQDPSRPSNSNSRSSNSSSLPPTYGYHNSFHTHAQFPDCNPPAYGAAVGRTVSTPIFIPCEDENLPQYSENISMDGVLGIQKELANPFTAAADLRWQDAYVVLRGTALYVHKIKQSHFAKVKTVTYGKLIASYSLQHAEVGIATDFQKTEPTPKHCMAKMIPKTARQRVYESDPHLFEPVREHCLRLRVEGEQLLLCAETQVDLLDWTEAIAAAIDISPPLEDRSEPRYRSLPRRNRRQRQLDSGIMANPEDLTNMEAGRRLIEEQERILRTLYPNLARSTSTDAVNERPSTGQQDRGIYEDEGLDPADVQFPPLSQTSTEVASQRRGSLPDIASADTTPATTTNDGISARPRTAPSRRHRSSSSDPSDPKEREVHRPSENQRLRYRRRCAPVLLASSPRASEIIFHQGRRVKIDRYEATLKTFELQPPRYDAHGWPKTGLATVVERSALPERESPDANPAAQDDGLMTDMASFSLESPSESVIEHDQDSIELAESSSEPATPMTRSKSKESNPMEAAGARLVGQKLRSSGDYITHRPVAQIRFVA